MAVVLHGIGVSKGIALGQAHIARHRQLDVVKKTINTRAVASEIQRFQQAINEVKTELSDIRERIPLSTPNEIYEFVDIHHLILQDKSLTEPPVELISEQHCNAEWALQTHRQRLAAMFDDMEDPYLRSRMTDIDQVIDRIQRHLLDARLTRNNRQQDSNIDKDQKDKILIIDDLSPADLLQLQQQGTAGIISETGSPLSHTAILARSLKIPAAMGVKRARQLFIEGEKVILDGERGLVLAGAYKDIERHYKQRIREAKKHHQTLSQYKNAACRSACGEPVKLRANLDFHEDLDLIKQESVDGIGLFRTEYLFLNRQTPPEETEQFEAYAKVVRALHGQEVTIRTLDLGADKQLSQTKRPMLATNPALGLRAVRLCLADRNLFIPQLRAILRAAACGPVKILIPMLCNSQELFQVKNLINATRNELISEGYEIPDNIPIGGMIETPAAALSAHIFAKHLDFLSIGTNDLIQYTLAIDRIDDQVSYLYDPLHPAILKLIHSVIDACRRCHTPVSMCGEMASDIHYTRLLLYLGLRDFSTQASSLLEVKQLINLTHIEKLLPLGRSLMRSTNPVRIQQLLREMNNQVAN